MRAYKLPNNALVDLDHIIMLGPIMDSVVGWYCEATCALLSAPLKLELNHISEYIYSTCSPVLREKSAHAAYDKLINEWKTK